MYLKVLHAYAHTLLWVKRSGVELTRDAAKKLEVDFATGQSENSGYRKANLKSWEDY